MKTHRSGYVSLTGRPNVGKSTFLNAVLGQKVSIVTPKSQTTRNRIIGVKTMRNAQIVFIDTPGIHRPRHRLGALMVKEARKAVKEVDVVLYIVEPELPSREDSLIIKMIENTGKKAILLINKIDKIKKSGLLPLIDTFSRLYRFEDIIPVSALKGDGLETVIQKTIMLLPEGPRYYPEDMVTDRLERFMVAEIIREKIIKATEEEIPHSVAVEIMGWKEEEKGPVVISANIYVEKPGQKGIIIGKGGAKLKEIGIFSRTDIENLLDSKVFLELFVKVKKHWRMSGSALTELGYS